MHTATERLYLTADRDRLVPEGDPDARWLFCVPGRQVPDTLARRYGLLDPPEPPPDAEPEPEPEAPEPEPEPEQGELRGKALDEALEAAGLPTYGRLAEKRARLAGRAG